MDFDFSPFFNEYKAILATADEVFKQVRSQFPEEVKCRETCSDCCHALFDLTLIEALYLNAQFNNSFSGDDRDRLLEKANSADRLVYKIKRKAYKAVVNGSDESDVLEKLAEERVRCPLLNESERCDLYAHRPVTCRFYGIPTSIGGRGHTCGLSGFETGKPYPTVKLENIHEKLQRLSASLLLEMKSKHAKLADLLVPVSMAMLTNYDDVYFGLKEPEPDPEEVALKKARRKKGRGK